MAPSLAFCFGTYRMRAVFELCLVMAEGEFLPPGAGDGISPAALRAGDESDIISIFPPLPYKFGFINVEVFI